MKISEGKFIIWGCKGQAKVLADVILNDLNAEIVAFFETDASVPSFVDNVPVHYGTHGYNKWKNSIVAHNKYSAIAAIGGESGSARYNYFEIFKADGFQTPTIVHPNATILCNADIGQNCQILAHAVIGVESHLGDACIVNTKSSVDHECYVSNGVHLAPGATLCGEVKIGRNTFIGAGVVVLPRVTIGANSIVGAGSVVTRDLPDNVVAYGNPAKVIRENKVE